MNAGFIRVLRITVSWPTCSEYKERNTGHNSVLNVLFIKTDPRIADYPHLNVVLLFYKGTSPWSEFPAKNSVYNVTYM